MKRAALATRRAGGDGRVGWHGVGERRSRRGCQALRGDPAYVDTEAERALSEGEVDDLRSAIRSADTPIYIAVLPASAADLAGGDLAEVASQLADAVGRPGTYGVVVEDRFRAGSTELPAGEAADPRASGARRQWRGHGGGAQRLRRPSGGCSRSSGGSGGSGEGGDDDSGVAQAARGDRSRGGRGRPPGVAPEQAPSGRSGRAGGRRRPIANCSRLSFPCSPTTWCGWGGGRNPPGGQERL